MKREDALAHIRIAGYHGDTRAAMRIYVENRISHKAYTDAYARGAELKKSGMACSCSRCKV